MPSLSLGITVDHGTFHIHAQDFGPRYDSTGQFWFKVIRTIAEICFRSSDMCRVWNRIFPPFRQAVHAVGQILPCVSVKSHQNGETDR